MEYLWHVLEQDTSWQCNGAEKLFLKFAFDGASMTSGTFVQEEIGAFQYLYDGQKLADVKSPNEAHMWIVYIGTESQDILWYENQFLY